MYSITVKDGRIVNNIFYFILFWQNNIIDCTYFGYKNATKHLSPKKKKEWKYHTITQEKVEKLRKIIIMGQNE
jgi:hypothetical protein